MLTPIWTPDDPSGSGDRFFPYSPKLRRFVSYSSKLEFQRWLLLEHDPEVIAFCEQPAVILVVIDGRVRRSRLDFWVLREPHRETFEEIKYASELRNPESRAHRQIEIQRKGLQAAGKEYAIVTDEEICANNTLLNSLRALLREFDTRYPTLIEEARPLFDRIAFQVFSYPGVTIDDILSQRPSRISVDALRLAIMEMIRLRILDAQVEKIVLTPSSALRPGPKFSLS